VEPEYGGIEGYEQVEASCDGLDNDCDGETDDPGDLRAPDGEMEEGVCAAAKQVCRGREGRVEPEYGGLEGYDPEDLPCDRRDNDCDGETDEGSAPEGWACISPGTFWMGSPEGEPGRMPLWEARHRVQITRPFLISRTEVTQGDWQAVMGDNPSALAACGDDCPVESVGWYRAIAYCNTATPLGERCYADPDDGTDYSAEDAEEAKVPVWRGLECTGLRLPTEAEWEYAARAGTEGPTYAEEPFDILGSRNAPALDPIAWYGGNSGVDYDGGRDCSDWEEMQRPAERCGTHPVASKAANPWGLHDMLGNVNEWVWDVYAPDYGGVDSPEQPVADPAGPPAGMERGLRCCAWNGRAAECRAAGRGQRTPERALATDGFRPARTLP